MTNTKAILGISFAAFFVVTMMSSAIAAPGYSSITSGAVSEQGTGYQLTTTAGGEIPRFADDYVNNAPIFGYAWLNGDFSGVIATIHPEAGDDSNQNPSAWHLHTVSLGFEGGSLCVQALGTDHGEGAQGGISISGDTMTVNISQQQAGITEFVNGASFTAAPSDNCVSGVEVFPINLVALS